MMMGVSEFCGMMMNLVGESKDERVHRDGATGVQPESAKSLTTLGQL